MADRPPLDNDEFRRWREESDRALHGARDAQAILKFVDETWRLLSG